MTARPIKKAPIVRLPPKSNFEISLTRSSQFALIFLGIAVVIYALNAGRFILAPISLGVVIGLMLGPIATRLERRGVPSALSALVVVLIFITAICALALALAAPLSFWVGRLPQIWNDLQLQLSQLQQPMSAVQGIRDQIRDLTGGGTGLTVAVEDGSAVESVVTFAPAFGAQILLFFASLYFFVATRQETRVAVLRLCFNRRLRWRAAHIFRDVERLVSRYLLSITLINIGMGICVGLALWAIGVPSPALWGALAGLLNYVVYIGPAIMAAVLFAVGLADFDTFAGSLMPPLVYLTINLMEAQFVTPMVIGRTMTLNPFVVLLALAFWIWMWGPVGGFIAIPALLIVYAILWNILPGANWSEGEIERAKAHRV